MRAFSDGELARLQATQEGAMQDTCVVQAYSSEQDEYGNPTVTYTDGDGIACGLQHLSPEELQGTGEVPQITARVRLPLETAIGAHDRVEVRARFGVDLETAQVFEVVGPARRGPSGLVVDLKVVG